MTACGFVKRAIVWLALAAAATGGPVAGQVAVERDVAYGRAAGQRLLLDVHRLPAGRQRRAAVLMVHGGGWVEGDKRDFVQATALAQMGYVVFNANYRLVRGGRNRFPAPLEDVQRAVRWIRASAGRYGVDPHRVAALGVSAGGHLVSLLGTNEGPRRPGDPLSRFSSRPTCVVDVAGPADLTTRFPAGPPMNVEQLVQGLIGRARGAAPAAYRQASPIYHIDRRTVPFLIVHGKADAVVPIAQSRRFYAALRRAGVPVTLVECQGGHDFALPQDQGLLARSVTAFLAAHLAPRPSAANPRPR